MVLSSMNAGAFQYEGENAKISLSGYLEGRAAYSFDRDIPREDPSTELGLELKTGVSTWLSTKLSLQAIDDGLVIDPGNKRLITQLDKIYQDKTPFVNIDEAYVDLYTARWISSGNTEVCVGQT
jgi:hypothetical protein